MELELKTQQKFILRGTGIKNTFSTFYEMILGSIHRLRC